MAEIVVHHLEKSRSHRVLWALEALGLPYRVEAYTRDPETMRADPKLRSIHPLGKSPVVTVNGAVLAETGAILEHLSELAGGKLVPPPGTDDHRRYRYFLHYAEGSLMPPLLVALITHRLRSNAPLLIKPMAGAVAGKIDQAFTEGELDLHLSFLERELGGREFFAGKAFSLADVQMSYPLEAGLARGGDRPRPNITAFLKRMRERDDYRAALKAGGDTELMPS